MYEIETDKKYKRTQQQTVDEAACNVIGALKLINSDDAGQRSNSQTRNHCHCVHCFTLFRPWLQGTTGSRAVLSKLAQAVFLATEPPESRPLLSFMYPCTPGFLLSISFHACLSPLPPVCSVVLLSPLSLPFYRPFLYLKLPYTL